MDAIFLFFEVQISGRVPSSPFCLFVVVFFWRQEQILIRGESPKTWHNVNPFLLEFKNQTQDWAAITSLCVFVIS